MTLFTRAAHLTWMLPLQSTNRLAGFISSFSALSYDSKLDETRKFLSTNPVSVPTISAGLISNMRLQRD